MTQDQILPLCKSLLSVDESEVMTAAKAIVNSVPDADLRKEITKLVTDYQLAKDSVEMHATFEAIVQYCKNQYASIYAQGFNLGSSYQIEIFNQSLAAVIKQQSQQIEEEVQGLVNDIDNEKGQSVQE